MRRFDGTHACAVINLRIKKAFDVCICVRVCDVRAIRVLCMTNAIRRSTTQAHNFNSSIDWLQLAATILTLLPVEVYERVSCK